MCQKPNDMHEVDVMREPPATDSDRERTISSVAREAAGFRPAPLWERPPDAKAVHRPRRALEDEAWKAASVLVFGIINQAKDKRQFLTRGYAVQSVWALAYAIKRLHRERLPFLPRHRGKCGLRRLIGPQP